MLQVNSLRPLHLAMEILQWCQEIKQDFSSNHRAKPVPSSKEEVPRTGSALNEQGENVAELDKLCLRPLPASNFKGTHVPNLPRSGPQPHRPDRGGFSAIGKDRAIPPFGNSA